MYGYGQFVYGFFPTMSMFSFCLDLCRPFPKGGVRVMLRGIFGAGRVRLCVPGGFLKAACPGKRPCSGRGSGHLPACAGLAKGPTLWGAFAGAPREGCKVLPFGFLASPAPVVVRTYWCRRCHLGRVWVVLCCKYTTFKIHLSSISAIIFTTIFYLLVG